MPVTTAPQHDWQLVITNLDGEDVGAIYDPVDLKYTRVESGSCELEFNTEDPTDLNLIEILPHKRKIKAFRDNELVFWGKIREPLVITQDGAQVKCADPWGFWNHPAHDNYTFTDATLEEIMGILWFTEGSWRTIDIELGDEVTSPTFTCKLKEGQRISEFVESLCSSNPSQGSWFRIDAQNDPEFPAIMHFYDYQERVDNDEARWEYGEHTLDNVTDFQVEHRGLCNRVRVYYKGGYEEVEDTGSIAEHGLIERWFRRPGIDDAGTAHKVAVSKLAITPYTIGSFSPATNAPQLFDDFDVGDKCRTFFTIGPPNRLSGKSMHYKTSDMIPTRVELTIDKSGVENMSFSDDSIHADMPTRRHLKGRHHKNPKPKRPDHHMHHEHASVAHSHTGKNHKHWVSGYTRHDGTHVRGHWAADPGYGTHKSHHKKGEK